MGDLIALRYRGQGAYRPGLPQSDVDGAEIAAIAAQRRIDPQAIIDEAIDSGLFTAEYAPDDTAAEPESFESMKKADLVALAADKGLDTTGTKADLVARLEADSAPVASEGAEAPEDTTAESPVNPEGDTNA